MAIITIMTIAILAMDTTMAMRAVRPVDPATPPPRQTPRREDAFSRTSRDDDEAHKMVQELGSRSREQGLRNNIYSILAA